VKINFRKGSWAILPALIVSFVSIFVSSPYANANSVSIPNAGFEDNTFTGWSRGSQTGNLGASINGGGTGVTIFNGSRTFTHGPNGAMGSPTVNGAPNPYYAPAVAAGSWTFSPKDGTYAVALQPKGEQTFNQAAAALGLSGTDNSAIRTMLAQQAAAAGFGGGNPTDAAWITREVQLTAGVVYTMSWNYMATDYVPFNDGSITSLVPVTVASTPVITVNNFEQSYALLGFTNPGTGDYSTNSYGATGWQVSTYEVSVSGTYKLGFTSFNLDDQGLPPVLMVDDEIGSTQKCVQGGSCETFGGVDPNNETAPTLPPTTTTEATTTTTSTTTTTVPQTTTTSTTTTSTTTTSTTTTSTTSTTSTVPESTSTTEVEVTTTTTTVFINTTVPPTAQPEVTNPPETPPEAPEEVFPQPSPDVVPDPEPAAEEEPEETTDSISEEVPVDTSVPEETVTTDPEVVTTTPEEETTTTEPVDTAPEEVTAEEVAVILEEIANASVEEVIDVLSTLSIEEVTAVIENISVEQLTEVLNDLPAEEVINLIESIDSAEALENIVDAISEETIDPDTAIAVIENGNFEELPIETVSEIFAAIEPDQFTEEQKTELATALTDAPTEVKESFEEEIDIYGDGFDDYTPTGSAIDVGTRKTVLAAAAALAASAALAPAAPSSGSSGGPSGGSSGGSGGSSGGTEGRSRKEEESEDGFSGEIAGPGEDDGEDFTKNSIYRYYIREGKEMKKFNLFGFSKKVWDITAGLAFTLAGSLVVYITLSGVTQKIAGIATLTAILVHYVHEILKNDE